MIRDYRGMAVFLSVLLSLGIWSVVSGNKTPEKIQRPNPIDGSQLARGIFLLELTPGRQITPRQGELLMPPAKIVARRGSMAGELKHRLVMALDSCQKEYLNHRWHQVGRVMEELPRNSNIAEAVADELQSSQRGSSRLHNAGKSPWWPGPDPDLEEITAGVIVLDRHEKLDPVTRKYIISILREFTREGGTIPVDHRELAESAMGVLSRDQLNVIEKAQLSAGGDFLAEYGEDLLTLISVRAYE